MEGGSSGGCGEGRNDADDLFGGPGGGVQAGGLVFRCAQQLRVPGGGCEGIECRSIAGKKFSSLL